jgi:hypothetical protein
MILIIPTWGPTTLLEERSRSIHNLPYPSQREQLPDGALLPFSYSACVSDTSPVPADTVDTWHPSVAAALKDDSPSSSAACRRWFPVLKYLVTLSPFHPVPAVDGFQSTNILSHCHPFSKVSKKDFIFISGSLYHFRIYTYEKLWCKTPGDR